MRRRRASRGPGLGSWRRREPSRPLAGTSWYLHESKPEGLGGLKRFLLIVLAALEVGILGWLLTSPALALRHVDVTGATHSGEAAVIAESGLRTGSPILSVDAATIRRKLLRDPWVRDASVTANLPDRVTVAISEWQPVAVYAAGPNGRPQFISSQAGVLGSAPAPDAALRITGPAGPDPRPGQRALDPHLLTALVNMARGLPGVIGQPVRGFDVDGCGNLTMTAGRGWRAYFGRVITPEEYAALSAKLAALKAISGDVNYNSPDLDYVNVENPALPAVKLKSAKPPQSPSPVPSARPSGGPVPTATPAPAPAPMVTCR